MIYLSTRPYLKMHKSFCFLKTLFFFSFIICVQYVYADQSTNIDANDSQLIEKYIQSKGYSKAIVFDSSVIKQFWVHNSVCSIENSINISLTNGESVPLPVQFINVSENQDCKIDIITQTPDITISVLNKKLQKISLSSTKQDFLQYHVFSTSFHLEDASDFFFNVKINSPSDAVRIIKIVFSFSNNKNSSFLSSPGTLSFSKDNISVTNNAHLDNDSLTITGKQSQVLSKNNIFVTDNPLKLSASTKNVGTNATRIYLGFAVYNEKHNLITLKNFPFNKSSNILTVISAEESSNQIIVDSDQIEWVRGAFIALDAKDDLSDIPNFSFVDGTMNEVKKLENGQAAITISKPLQKAINKGTKIRIHGPGSGMLYINNAVLNPGEEQSFSASIVKEESFIEYSPKALPKGTYYVKPILFSYSLDSEKENSVLIKDFSVSY